MKANVSDVSRTITEIANSLETKLSFEDSQNILKDFVLKTDVQYILNEKVGIEEVKQLLDIKLDINDHKNDFSNFNNKFEEFQLFFEEKMQNCISNIEIQDLYNKLDKKANLSEMNESLETKANKQSVSNALHRKANKTDVEMMLSRKPELVKNIFYLILF